MTSAIAPSASAPHHRTLVLAVIAEARARARRRRRAYLVALIVAVATGSGAYRGLEGGNAATPVAAESPPLVLSLHGHLRSIRRVGGAVYRERGAIVVTWRVPAGALVPGRRLASSSVSLRGAASAVGPGSSCSGALTVRGGPVTMRVLPTGYSAYLDAQTNSFMLTSNPFATLGSPTCPLGTRAAIASKDPSFRHPGFGFFGPNFTPIPKGGASDGFGSGSGTHGSFSWLLSLAVQRATRASPCAPPEGGQAVRFLSTDGKPLAGAVWGSGSVGIVVAHDADSRLCEWARPARFLSRHGFRVLLFDYRTNPFLSQSGSYPPGTFRFDHDIAGGVSFLRGLGSKKIVLGGDGVGGLAALVAAQELGSAVSGVFTLTAGGIKGTTDSLGDPAQPDDLDALAAVKQLPAPALFLGAASDTNVRALYRASVSSYKRWVVLPQSALSVNGFGMSAWSAKTRWARLARKTVISFIQGHTSRP